MNNFPDYGLSHFGITVSRHEQPFKKALAALTRKHNHGRSRAVSLKRPSPQLSTPDYHRLQTQAVLNTLRNDPTRSN